MISGIAFDRHDRLSRLRAFSIWSLQNLLDRLNRPDRTQSIQAMEVVSVVLVVRVVCDRLGSVSIWSSRSFKHLLRRLGRSGRSERSYGNQALRIKTDHGKGKIIANRITVRGVETQKEFIAPTSLLKMLQMNFNDHTVSKVPDGRKGDESHWWPLPSPSPFRCDDVTVPNNKEQANKRAKWQKKKMLRDSQYRSDYVAFVNDIITKEYCTKSSNWVADVNARQGCGTYPTMGPTIPKNPVSGSVPQWLSDARSRSDKLSSRRTNQIPRRPCCFHGRCGGHGPSGFSSSLAVWLPSFLMVASWQSRGRVTRVSNSRTFIWSSLLTKCRQLCP